MRQERREPKVFDVTAEFAPLLGREGAVSCDAKAKRTISNPALLANGSDPRAESITAAVTSDARRSTGSERSARTCHGRWSITGRSA